MTPDIVHAGKLNSLAEDLFMELFCDTFGPEKSQHIFIQYPFTDISEMVGVFCYLKSYI